jgi:hypothetical protein
MYKYHNLNPHGVLDLGQCQIRSLVSTASDFLIASRSTRLRQTTNNLGVEMAKKAAKKAAKKTAKKRTRVVYTKADVREMRAHSRARTSVKKIAKAMKRSEGSLRQKSSALGIRLGHRR